MRMKPMMIAMLLGILSLSLASGLGAAAKDKKKLSKEEKQAAKLAKQEEKLIGLLGGPENWKPKVLENLRKGMSCQEVSAFFRGVDCSDIIPSDTAGLGSAIARYKFHFVDSGLYAVTIVFGARVLDEKRFTTALANVAEKKWGPAAGTGLAGARWTNPDYDSIEFAYKDSCWELKTCLPFYDPGPVNLENLSPENIRAELENLLGPAKQYLPSIITSLSGGMSSEQVAAVFPTLGNSTPGSSHHFEKVSIENHPLVAGLHFSFKNDRLNYVNLVFHYQIPREQFQEISFAFLKSRWGKNARLSKDGERLSRYANPGFQEMKFEGNRWEFRIDMEGIKGSVAVKPSASNDGASLQGLWTLTAARQGQQTESMTGGTKRQLRFKGDRFFMLENGTVVLQQNYIQKGKTLFFTEGPKGNAVKEFGQIVSHKASELILRLNGEKIEMIFKKTS